MIGLLENAKVEFILDVYLSNDIIIHLIRTQDFETRSVLETVHPYLTQIRSLSSILDNPAIVIPLK